MTALPPHLDELVSAYLDGEAAPSEVEIVEADPVLLGRVDELRAVRDRFNTAGAPPDAAQREAHLSAALGLFDELQSQQAAPTLSAVPTAAPNDARARAVASPTPITQAPATPANGSVSSLDERRERRGAGRGRLWLGAVAAAALLFVAGIFAIGGPRSISNETADQATEAVVAADTASDAADDGGLTEAASIDEPASDVAGASAADDAMADMDEASPMEAADEEMAEEAMADEEMADDESFAAAAPEVLDSRARFGLGEFASLEELDAAASARGFIEPEVFDFPNCQALVEELADAEEPTLVAVGVVDGVELEVHQLPGISSRIVTAADDCTVVTILE